MMTHQGEGGMLAYLDGELDTEDRDAFERHLAECAVCEAELGRLQDDAELFSGAVALLVAPVRTEAALAGVRRAHGQRRARSMTQRLLPYAATLVLGVAGVASATVPASPVYGWPATVFARLASLAEGRDDAPVAVQPADEPAAAGPVVVGEAGVSIRPLDGAVRIVVRGADPALQVRARLVESPQAEVIAVGEASRARFQTGAGSITVHDPGPGELRLDLPESAARITVEINGLPYLSREGDRLRVHRPAMDAAGGELRFEVGRAAAGRPRPAP
jgi:hypothetical protein